MLGKWGCGARRNRHMVYNNCCTADALVSVTIARKPRTGRGRQGAEARGRGGGRAKYWLNYNYCTTATAQLGAK